ncbi:uncharacterized protein LOC128956687 [Oppia nitens]|uniref:uncharacterized protein LOC128956687 n=1 Tax=Oppia nitens TaxID=1686743 RepID=UPI0023DC6486|nr:uncharacterized protein LOC128956687 [Oppia nitens]
MLFINSDNRVHGLGANAYGSLGLGHNQWVSEPQELVELRDKQITDIFNGKKFVIFKTSDNFLYICGDISKKFCTTSDVNARYLRPMIVQIDGTDVLVDDISCGSYHILVLTNKHEVYGWGSNRFGQIGSRDTKFEDINTPKLIDFNGNYCIKSVRCFEHQSFALTSDGQVFSWGYNHNNQLGCTTSSEIICRPQLINDLRGITSVQSGAGNTFFINTATNDIYVCGQYVDKNSKTNPLYEKLVNKTNRNLTIASINLVTVYSYWFYKNNLYISMEYCSLSLKKVIQLKAPVFSRQPDSELMTCMEYYLSCEILRELLDCVRYLHELQPPVLHRDLKPDNILIGQNISENNRFVKLCDFGLSVDETVCDTLLSGAGTQLYTAREAYDGCYTAKGDVYSIGFIVCDLFDTDINNPRDRYSDYYDWSDKYCRLMQIVGQTMQGSYDARPTCAQIIDQQSDWALDSRYITGQLDFNDILEQLKHRERDLREDELGTEPEFWEFFYTFLLLKTNCYNLNTF